MGEITNYIVRDDKLMGSGVFGPRFFLHCSVTSSARESWRLKARCPYYPGSSALN